MVTSFKRKELLLPIIFGILFSILYHILPFKYFSISTIGFLGTIAACYDIRIGILAGVFAIPFLPELSIILYMVFLIGVFFYKQGFREHTPLTKDPIHLPIIFYLTIITISTITSINPRGSFRDLAIHLAGIGFVFVAVNSIKTLEDFNKLVTVLVLSGTIIALIGLYQYIVGVNIKASWLDVKNNPDIKARVYSLFGNPNILAEYLIMIIPMSLALFWSSKKLHKKIIFLGTSLILTLALVLTYSRGGWLGFAFSILIFVILLEWRLLLSLIPIAIGAIYLLPQTILNRILSMKNLTDSSNAYRIKIWEISMDIIRDHWVVGLGFGHLPFKQTFETYIRTMPNFHAHNTYLETAAEMGIPGLIVFLLFIFVIFKYSIHELIKNQNRYIKVMGAGALAGLSGLLAHGLVENVLYLTKIIIMFWIIIGFILILTRISKEEKTLG